MDENNSYHGVITGKEAVKRLKKVNNDSYLCRFSSRNQKYVLSLVKNGPRKVGHFELSINKSSQAKYKVEGMEKHFETIDELLRFYETNRIHPEFDNIGTRLTLHEYTNRIHSRPCTIQ
jgi:hypothetical protein